MPHQRWVYLLICVAAAANAQSVGPTGVEPKPQPSPTERTEREAPLTLETSKEGDARLKKIRSESSSSKPASEPRPEWAKEWAGVYVCSTGFRTEEYGIAPRSGFVHKDESDAGVGTAAWGDISEQVDGGVRVRMMNGAGSSAPRVETVYFVRWGDRRYLVAESRMIEFCGWANAKSGFCWSITSGFPVNEADDSKPILGTPTVPPQYRKFVWTAPLTARVVEVIDVETVNGAKHGNVRLDRGEDHGVYPGLRLEYRRANGRQTMLVETVEDARCTASFHCGPTAYAKAVAPAVDQEVCTRPK